MNEDIETISYDPRTPLHRTNLPPALPSQSLYSTLHNHNFQEIGMLYTGMSISPDIFRKIFDAYEVEYEELEQELRNRLPAAFLRDINNNWQRYQVFLGAVLKRLA